MNFPIVMINGNANTPQRFWYVAIVYNQEEYEWHIKRGYVKSMNQTINKGNGNVKV